MIKFTCIALLFVAFLGNSQEQEVAQFGKNEIKLNMFYLVIGAAELSYERNLNDASSIGMSVLIPIGEGARDEINFVLTPYYRLFFGNKPAQGFFFEGFGMLNSTKTYQYFNQVNNGFFTTTEERKNVVDFALGFAIGGKFVLREKIVAEVTGGIGRNLLNSNENQYSAVVPRFNIAIGYRF